VVVRSGDETAVMDLFHDNSNAEITTSTGNLKLNPSAAIDLAGNNLRDNGGGGTVYSATNEHVVRDSVYINHKHQYTSGTQNPDADIETVRADTSVGSISIGLKDTNQGHNIRIIDIGGNASGNNVSISIVAGSDADTLVSANGDITTDNGYRVFEYDGNGTWYEVGSN
jgi:hypothetical protein